MLLRPSLPSHTHCTPHIMHSITQHPAKQSPTHPDESLPLAITLPTPHRSPLIQNTHWVACTHRLASITPIKPPTHVTTNSLLPLPPPYFRPAAPGPNPTSHRHRTSTNPKPNNPHLSLPSHTPAHTAHILDFNHTHRHTEKRDTSRHCVSPPLLPYQAHPTAHMYPTLHPAPIMSWHLLQRRQGRQSAQMWGQSTRPIVPDGVVGKTALAYTSHSNNIKIPHTHN
jgi:hypothetical protein